MKDPRWGLRETFGPEDKPEAMMGEIDPRRVSIAGAYLGRDTEAKADSVCILIAATPRDLRGGPPERGKAIIFRDRDQAVSFARTLLDSARLVWGSE